MSSFLGHVHGYGSASLKQNTDLACYCSNQSIKIAIQGYIVEKDRFQTSVATQADWPAQVGAFIRRAYTPSDVDVLMQFVWQMIRLAIGQ